MAKWARHVAVRCSFLSVLDKRSNPKECQTKMYLSEETPSNVYLVKIISWVTVLDVGMESESVSRHDTESIKINLLFLIILSMGTHQAP